MTDRLDERQELRRLLLSGNNVLMLAPRRVGKTWLLEQIEHDLSKEGYPCIRIDLEGMRTEQKFLIELCNKIEATQDAYATAVAVLKAKFRQILSGTAGETIAQIATRVEPREFLEVLVSALNQQERRTLILIDEFSLFILEQAKQDAPATRSLLYHLRKLQQEYRNVSWLLTGSVGLDVVARRFDLQGALLGMETFPLSPFSEDDTRAFLVVRSDRGIYRTRLEFDAAGLAYLVRELGWLAPYYIDLIAKNTRPAAGTAATEQDVAQAFETVLSPPFRLHFSPWEEHIRKNFEKQETDRLHAILAKCCEAVDGETESTLLTIVPNRRDLKDLLTCLANDGYLAKDGDRWHFRSGLLRRYWLEYIA